MLRFGWDTCLVGQLLVCLIMSVSLEMVAVLLKPGTTAFDVGACLAGDVDVRC